MSTLQENSYKKFNIEAKSAIQRETFDLIGVSSLVTEKNSASFIFKGNINTIMKKISEIELRNVSIEEPDLEEIFMHYYAKED
jgi:ABC-2 type transport system ATP-binding protein